MKLNELLKNIKTASLFMSIHLWSQFYQTGLCKANLRLSRNNMLDTLYMYVLSEM